MTNEEAIKDLKAFVKMKTTMQPTFLSVCIEALEKQIPKKPTEDGWLYCSSCGIDILMQTDTNGHRYNYCPNCGQAILWED